MPNEILSYVKNTGYLLYYWIRSFVASRLCVRFVCNSQSYLIVIAYQAYSHQMELRTRSTIDATVAIYIYDYVPWCHRRRRQSFWAGQSCESLNIPVNETARSSTTFSPSHRSRLRCYFLSLQGRLRSRLPIYLEKQTEEKGRLRNMAIRFLNDDNTNNDRLRVFEVTAVPEYLTVTTIVFNVETNLPQDQVTTRTNLLLLLLVASILNKLKLLRRRSNHFNNTCLRAYVDSIVSFALSFSEHCRPLSFLFFS